MDCRKARQLIPRAADKELDGLPLARLDSHVASCSDCARVLQSERAAILAIEEGLGLMVRDVAAPAGFASAVAQRAALEVSGGRARSAGFVDWLAAALGAAASNRRVVASAACASVLAATLLMGMAVGRVLDSSSGPGAQVRSGQHIAFVVRPRADGRVNADVGSHRYCRITRAGEEALR